MPQVHQAIFWDHQSQEMLRLVGNPHVAYGTGANGFTFSACFPIGLQMDKGGPGFATGERKIMWIFCLRHEGQRHFQDPNQPNVLLASRLSESQMQAFNISNILSPDPDAHLDSRTLFPLVCLTPTPPPPTIAHRISNFWPPEREGSAQRRGVSL